MTTIARDVFVISDLHIGGAPPVPTSADESTKCGFRMMTHQAELANFIRRVAGLPGDPAVELVINGDFVDFLAEAHEGPARWQPFIYDPVAARTVFERIATRDGDRLVFQGAARSARCGQVPYRAPGQSRCRAQLTRRPRRV